MHKLFTVCTEQVRSQHAANGLPNPTHLDGELRFDQAQDQQVVMCYVSRLLIHFLLRSRNLCKGPVSFPIIIVKFAKIRVLLDNSTHVERLWKHSTGTL